MRRRRTKLPWVPKSAAMQRIEREHGRDVRLVLRDLLAEEASVEGVAVRFGVSVHTVRNWIGMFGRVEHRPVLVLTGLGEDGNGSPQRVE